MFGAWLAPHPWHKAAFISGAHSPAGHGEQALKVLAFSGAASIWGKCPALHAEQCSSPGVARGCEVEHGTQPLWGEFGTVLAGHVSHFNARNVPADHFPATQDSHAAVSGPAEEDTKYLPAGQCMQD